MPLFEYRCEACGHQFEFLTRAGVTPSCPKCHAEQLEKQLSVFAVGAAGSSAAGRAPAEGACAGCAHAGGPGCGMAGMN
jgi:putative FmdB family regulatory protein